VVFPFFSCAMRAAVSSSFTVRGRAQGPDPRRSVDHLPTQLSSKDHDHGKDEEEEEGEEGREEGIVIRAFF
jgi:hypothetical protein